MSNLKIETTMKTYISPAITVLHIATEGTMLTTSSVKINTGGSGDTQDSQKREDMWGNTSIWD